MNRYNALLLLPALLCIQISANMGSSGFKPWGNKYFVETGCFHGDGIQRAIDAGVFEKFISVEIDPKYIQECNGRFRHDPSVQIFRGDSSKCLFDVIKVINEPITFWLDGHDPQPHIICDKRQPILDELDQIKQHHLNTHTILIDDMHMMGSELFEFVTQNQIIEKLLEINPDYKFTFVRSGNADEVINGVMIAYLEK